MLDGHIVITIVDGGFVVRRLSIKGGVPVLEARNYQMSYPMTIADEDVVSEPTRRQPPGTSRPG